MMVKFFITTLALTLSSQFVCKIFIFPYENNTSGYLSWIRAIVQIPSILPLKLILLEFLLSVVYLVTAALLNVHISLSALFSLSIGF